MAITVRDLWLYDPNFEVKDIIKLTGKKNFKKNDTIVLSRIPSLGDKDLSVFVARKEGKSFLRNIQDDKIRTEIANASNVKDEKQNTQNIPMDKSVFDIKKRGDKND